MYDFVAERARMVHRDLGGRGIGDEAVLSAMATVPREFFVPENLKEFAYRDAPLPIAEGQTISQPYIVAVMAEALELAAGDKVLEIGTGSGYAAAVLSRMAGQVFTVERHGALATQAAEALTEVGYHNVHVRHADGTLGWPENGPYDAILVSAGGREPPESLVAQLAPGGRLVIPVGDTPRLQELIRLRRLPSGELSKESLGSVRFVPLIGEEGWAEQEAGSGRTPSRLAHERRPDPDEVVTRLIEECAEPIHSIDDCDPGSVLERASGAKVLLLGESTHGTSEFYRLRAAITRGAIESGRVRFIAIEGDWPDARAVDLYVRPDGSPPSEQPFQRFPTWMWRNAEFAEFMEWLRLRNCGVATEERVGVFGLDLYSLYRSIDSVLDYLDRVDPEAARVARARYGCLTPWQADPAAYGRAAVSGRYRSCEADVVAMLDDLLVRHLEYEVEDGFAFLDAAQNAQLIANAERYYRIMYRGSDESWNLRDTHMFETLERLLAFYGAEAGAVVWAHNSHVGDASATEMGRRGQHNIGQLAAQRWGANSFRIGFGTDRGTVMAADDWDGPAKIKAVRPALPGSYEQLCADAGVPSFFLHLREASHAELLPQLAAPRLERAIGVIYRPETELQSHYFQAVLPRQFDEYVWIAESEAVHAIKGRPERGVPDTYPFGL